MGTLCTSGKPPDATQEKYLAAAAANLERAAVLTRFGISWKDEFTTKDEKHKDKVCYNLGLAHGSTAIIIY